MSCTVRSAKEGTTYFFRDKQITSSSFTEVSQKEKEYLETIKSFEFVFGSIESKSDEKTEHKEEEKTSSDYPKMISRGKYELSNGETFEGNKADASEAENALEK